MAKPDSDVGLLGCSAAQLDAFEGVAEWHYVTPFVAKTRLN
jgi:hypothetical protein